MEKIDYFGFGCIFGVLTIFAILLIPGIGVERELIVKKVVKKKNKQKIVFERRRSLHDCSSKDYHVGDTLILIKK